MSIGFPATFFSCPPVRSARIYTSALERVYGLMVTQQPRFKSVLSTAGVPSSSYFVAHTAEMAAPSSL